MAKPPISSIKTGTNTVVIKPGQKIILPDDVDIISLVTDGSITVTSSCNNLPDPSAYKCWRFVWEDMSGDTGYNDAYFTDLEIAGTKYSLDISVSETNSYDNGPDFLSQAVPIVVPAGLVTDIDSSDPPVLSTAKCFKISIPDNLGQPILYWTNPMTFGTQLSAMFAQEDECDCESGL